MNEGVYKLSEVSVWCKQSWNWCCLLVFFLVGQILNTILTWRIWMNKTFKSQQMKKKEKISKKIWIGLQNSKKPKKKKPKI